MSPSAFDLDRFVQAQERTYATVLAELKAGHKRTHWIWFIFPQLRGLGFSAMSQAYGLSGLAEASAYLAHPILGTRLLECIQVLLTHAGTPANVILGETDALKLRSCLTLFAAADPGNPLLGQALQAFFNGQLDTQTTTLLTTTRTRP
ncbi:MAG: DUF1810 domain-containing protein [Acidobacteriota bacterium]